MLHVLDGDAGREKFRSAGLGGEVVAWRGMMSEGATPHGLRTEADWRVRIDSLRALGVPAGSYRADLDATLARVEQAIARGEDVILWFDLDLFCRVDAAFLAGRFPGAKIMNALGTHSLEDLRAMYDARVPLSPLLARAWHAYAAPDPRGLLALQRDQPWIALHLPRFPDARTGLDVVEARVIEALRGGPLAFRELYVRVAVPDFGPTTYGLPDIELASRLEALARGPRPLVTLDGPRPDRARATATRDGLDALSGRVDRLEIQPVDRWVGGVHITGPSDAWRWNPDARTLVAPPGA